MDETGQYRWLLVIFALAICFSTATGQVELSSSSLDMNTGELALAFSTAVNPSLTIYSGITLQSAADTPTSTYTLTGGTNLGDGTETITVTLTMVDLDAIKTDLDLAVSVESTYVSLMEGIVTDAADVTLLSAAVVQQAALFTEDMTSPELVSFDLDMNTGMLILTFSEPVSGQAFNVSGITLQSSQTMPTSTFILVDTLSGSGSGDNFTSVITVSLSVSELNSIKKITELAVSLDTTYLSLDEGTTVDTNDNPSTEVPSTSAITASNFIGDLTSPVLESFLLDLDTDSLVLTFSETVDVSSLLFTALTLQSDMGGTGSSFTLTSGAVVPENDPVVIMRLGDQDINSIKFDEVLATSETNTFLSFQSNLITDMNRNPVVPASGVQVSVFIPDTTPPRLVSFDLNLSEELLILKFDETIHRGSFNASGVTLLSSADPSTAQSVTLTYVYYYNVTITEVTVYLGFADLVAIKANPDLANNALDTYLALRTDTVRDTFGNPNIEIPFQTPLAVDSFTTDLLSPILYVFDLDLNVGMLNLTFNEPVNISSFNPMQITFQSAPDSSATMLTLTGASSIELRNLTVLVGLSANDIDMLAELEDLATAVNTTYLSFTAELVTDMYGNSVEPVTTDLAIQVRNLQMFQDPVPPEIVSFSIDLNSGFLSLSFSEEVSSTTFDVSRITLQSSSANPEVQFTLTGGELNVSSDNTVIGVRLTLFDLYELNQRNFDSAERIYLSVSEGLVQDNAGNPSTAISSNSALQVSRVVPDTTQPHLTAFDLDMNRGVLLLYFSEIVNISGLDVTGITLQSGRDGTGFSHTLTTSLGSGPDYAEITVAISENDLNALKSNLTIATSSQNTFISLAAGIVTDLYRLSSLPIATTAAQIVRVFIQDTTSPVLFSFDLDLNVGLMDLTFSEPMLFDSFDLTEFTLQSSEDMSLTSSYQLTGGIIVTATNGLVIVAELFQRDRDALFNMMGLAESRETTFITVGTGAAEDTNNNVLLAIVFPLQVSTFTPEIRPPKVNHFDLDMNMGTLTLYFNKIVILAHLDVTGITLQSDMVKVVDTVSFTLTSDSANFTTNNATSVQIPLASSNLDSLKTLMTLATDENTTYLSITEGIVIDGNGNRSLAIPIDNGLAVRNFIPDVTPPEVFKWVLDLKDGILNITFNEPVDLETLKINFITVQARARIPGLGSQVRIPNRQLKSSVGEKTEFIRKIALRLSEEDIAQLTGVEDFCTRPNNTFLSCLQGAIKDNVGNSLKAINYRGDGIEVSNLILPQPVTQPTVTPPTLDPSDIWPPIVVDFTLDVRDKKELVLTFNETVGSSSVNVALITLVVAGSGEYTLKSSSVTNMEDDRTITIALSTTDHDGLCDLTSDGQEPKLYHLEGMATDVNNNQIRELARESALKPSSFLSCNSGLKIAAINTLLLISCAFIGLLVIVH